MNKSRINSEIEHFSNMSHIWWGALTPAGQKRYDNKLKKMLEFYDVSPKTKILEIGCGDGEYTKRLRTLNAQIIGTDITPILIEKAKKDKKNQKIKFKVDNAEKMSFKDNTFDIVCGISILHHVDYQKTLKECFRVLKKGGIIFFTEPNFLNPFLFACLNMSSLRTKFEFSRDETAFIRWQLESLMKQIGFKNVVVSNYDFLHPLTPESAISKIEKLSTILEKIPLIKEISGSLIVYGKKM